MGIATVLVFAGIVVLFTSSFGGGKVDGRYKTGYRGNDTPTPISFKLRVRVALILWGIAALFFLSDFIRGAGVTPPSFPAVVGDRATQLSPPRESTTQTANEVAWPPVPQNVSNQQRPYVEPVVSPIGSLDSADTQSDPSHQLKDTALPNGDENLSKPAVSTKPVIDDIYRGT